MKNSKEQMKEAVSERFVKIKLEGPKKAPPTFLEGVRLNPDRRTEFSSKFYGTGGKSLQGDSGAYAKQEVYDSGVEKFFIKIATAGSMAGRMLNPIGLYFYPGDEDKPERLNGK